LDKFTYEELIERYNAQRAERFAYIDFVLRFLGGINRSDLLDFFGIGDAAASKEIAEYKKLREENVVYDRVLRKNVIMRDSFTPLIDMGANTALGMLANGFNKNKLYDRPMLPYQRVGAIPHSLNVEFVSVITRAIHSSTAIKCEYISGNSNNHSERTLLPTALFYDGQSWMFRAFHRNPTSGKAKFKCFDFSRLSSVTECSEEGAKLSETLSKDSDWHLVVPLKLSLHPSLSEEKKTTLIKEFGLANNKEELLFMEKAVLVYCLKKHWKIDVGDVPSKDGNYNFHLKNGDSYKSLDCMENVFD
jgi:hypothetical protein